MIRVNALSFAKMLRCLTDGPSTIREVCDETGLHYVTTREYMAALHKEKVIYIAAWDRDAHGRSCIKVYGLGDGYGNGTVNTRNRRRL